MAKETDFKKIKVEHIHLAEVVKGLHKRLRRDYRANDRKHEQVWQEHIKDQSSLQVYADAMHRLATDHWSVFPETRIDWCRNVIIEYFYQNGLRIALEKDAKRRYHELLYMKQQAMTPVLVSVPPTEVVIKSPASLMSTADSTHQEGDSLQQEADSSTDMTDNPRGTPHNCENNSDIEITLPINGRIRLLDVGSCYNPFVSFDEFDVLGIDLCPAKETVLQCDFLQLSTPTMLPLHHPLTYDLHSLKSPLYQLPSCSFHVVVFSLFLGYLPSPEQRWQCCVKAHVLLPVNGLLLIVTADSHSPHRNAPMMKSWKQALEILGFQRWKYEKKAHIHCMAFRKLSQKPADAALKDGYDVSRAKSMIYIPQDFNNACYDDVQTAQAGNQELAKETETFMKLAMEELPMFEES